jgi:transcriptional regulator with XRE-family HTH domain
MLIDTEKPPNGQTRAMGELIRKAREDAGLTQAQLAKKIHRKRLAISEMENGKVEINGGIIPLLASSLDKPISYFFRAYVQKEITSEQLSPQEQELLIHFRNIWPEHLREVAINLIKVIENFDPMKMIDAIQ